MSVATGIPPQALGDLEPSMWHAVADAHAEPAWGYAEELLAQAVELLHALYRLQVKRPPPQLRIPRPVRAQAQGGKPRVLTAAEQAEYFGAMGAAKVPHA